MVAKSSNTGTEGSEPTMSPWNPPPQVQQKVQRDASSQLDILIVGAGLGGLGAAISLLLAGHKVTVLESASEIGEIGAGIQALPNSSRILMAWGLREALERHATKPRYVNMIGWKGNQLGRMDFHAYTAALGAPFWDFHRANLHRCLLDRAVELGAGIRVKSRVVDVDCPNDGLTATVVLDTGVRMAADLVVGADGISSRLREILLGRPDPPTPTGDLAYRLLIDADDMRADPELRGFIEDPQVNYWLGPDAHAVNYVLRGGRLFNMVLLVPDDMPPGTALKAVGSVAEMQARYADWDPRIPKILALCRPGSVEKWRLCIRPTLARWTHPAGAFTLLGDAVHATLPYLASGAGMALEDAAVLGACLARVTDNASPAQKRRALAVYEDCRRERTERVVARGSYQQHLYHLHDGDEQRARDARFQHFEAVDGEWMRRAQEDGEQLAPRLESGDDPLPWRYNGIGCWLLTYDAERDVEERWAKSELRGEDEEERSML